MKKLLLAGVALIAMSAAGNAAVIEDLGINPTSAQGRFESAPNSASGAFEDQFTFQLQSFPAFITFASATNSYTGPADFISGFTGELFRQVGGIDPSGVVGDDIGFGPATAVACATNPGGCQILAGAALLDPGSYYLEIRGTGGGTSGYGGNLTVAAVPAPGVGMGLIPLVAAFGWIARRRKKQLALNGLAVA